MKYLLSTVSGVQSTSLSAIGILFTIVACLLLLALPRRLTLFPILLTACYMTFGQQLVFGGMHFTILRVLVIVAYCRILMRGEYRQHKWQRLDKMVFCWSLCSIVFFTILWGSSAAVVNRLGVACDSAGLYFAFRILVQDNADVKMACRMAAVLLVPLAICMAVERMSGGKNLFSSLGGVPEFSEIRQGLVRCQGPFAHPILAGSFGAVWTPMFIGLWRGDRRSRGVALLGLVSSLAITIEAGSSGPILTYAAGIAASCMWVWRRYLRLFRWSVVLLLIALQCVMNDSVWFLFARVNILSGSTGWHRSNLIDQWVKHFGDWWFCGTKDLGSWGVFAGDVTNQFILEAVNGGMLTAGLFIGIFVTAFSITGKAAKWKVPVSSRALAWAAGSAIFAHAITFLSVSYFDQNVVNFYLMLAMVAVFRYAPAQRSTVAPNRFEQEQEAGVLELQVS